MSSTAGPTPDCGNQYLRITSGRMHHEWLGLLAGGKALAGAHQVSLLACIQHTAMRANSCTWIDLHAMQTAPRCTAPWPDQISC
jgi:hypothetical protein